MYVAARKARLALVPTPESHHCPPWLGLLAAQSYPLLHSELRLLLTGQVPPVLYGFRVRYRSQSWSMKSHILLVVSRVAPQPDSVRSAEKVMVQTLPA